MKQLFGFGDPDQYKRTKLFDYFGKIKNQKIDFSLFQFNMTEKSFQNIDLIFSTKIDFKFNDLEMTLKSGCFKNEKWEIVCILKEGDPIVQSLVQFADELTSVNSVTYDGGLKMEKNFFREDFDLDKKLIPCIYYNYSREVFSLSKYNFNFTKFSTCEQKIKIQLTDLVTVFLDHEGGLFFHFEDYLSFFDLKDTNNRYFSHNTRSISSSRYGGNNPNLFDFNHIAFEILNVKNLSKQYFKSDIVINDVNLKFEEGFLELISTEKKSECLIRIPLHKRETPEIFVKSVYNSIIDDEFFKSLNMNLVKYSFHSIHFQFK